MVYPIDKANIFCYNYPNLASVFCEKCRVISWNISAGLADEMTENTRRPTLADVARKANVSMTSVSRLLNNSGPINQDTRHRIEEAIAALGYKPKRSAASRTSGTIAVLTGSLLNPYFPEIVRGIQEEADNHEWVVALFTLTDHPQRQQQILQRLSKRSVDGIVLMGSAPFPGLVELRDRYQIPLVIINRKLVHRGVGCIIVDFGYAGYQAAQHLIGLQHTRLGFLTPYPNADVSLGRQRGIEAALAAAGLSLRPECRPVITPGFDMDAGFHGMGILLALPDDYRPTAVIAYNDAVAMGALHAVVAHGLRVPEDISIVGFDDIALAAHTIPPLTTISQPKYRMGKLAVQTLYQIRQDPEHSGMCTVLESPLVVRHSTAPLATSRMP